MNLCQYCGTNPVSNQWGKKDSYHCDSCDSEHKAHKRHRDRAKKNKLPRIPFTRAEVYERDNGLCFICLEPVDLDTPWIQKQHNPGYPTLDHVVPLALDCDYRPGHVPVNAQLAHFQCNSDKKDNAVLILQGKVFPLVTYCCRGERHGKGHTSDCART